ncbi:hypothetical protein ACFZAD_39630 [Streptomyces iakyrus]|uniref:DNA polymerase thumb domain-containing protein n=1 Tax=Streptomyces iakyrus TaxID=68219 RepID=UPI0036E4C5DA
MLAAMACALTPPGQRTVVDDSPEAIAAFLRPRPVHELPGVGARTAATLGEYGLHTVGDIVNVPQLTLQRLLGARDGRALDEHAQGRDTTIVDPTPAPAPASIGTEHRFVRDELDPAEHRRALLALARCRRRGHGPVPRGGCVQASCRASTRSGEEGVIGRLRRPLTRRAGHEADQRSARGRAGPGRGGGRGRR